MKALVVLGFLALAAGVAAQENEGDGTLQEGNSGSAVVEAVVDRIQASCIFPEDKLLFRRLAFVESADGTVEQTYRDSYHGGIWQVDQNMYKLTQDPGVRVFLLEYIKGIQTHFGIDWPSTTWEDLCKPLHSCLGSMLYMIYQGRTHNNGIPRSIEEQADLWILYYRPQGDKQYFIDSSYQLETGCTNRGVDLLFMVDGSSSIGSANFINVKTFINDVVDSFEIGPDKTQVAVLLYSTSAKMQFHLDDYSTKEDIHTAVNSIRYSGGQTYTHLALEKLRTTAFSRSNGARPLEKGHPRVAIVLTDGKSNKPLRTVIAANAAHDADITMFAAGVGPQIDLKELEAIASDPMCLHMFLLEHYDEVDDLKYAIEKGTCDAPIIIGPGNNGTNIDTSLPPGGNQNCKIKIEKNGVKIKVHSNHGHANFYLARSTYPSKTFYEHVVEASPGNDASLFLDQQSTGTSGDAVFCNIQGDEEEDSDLSIGCEPVVDPCDAKPCGQHGDCESQGDGYICKCHVGWTGDHCDTEEDLCKPNPCVNCACDYANGGVNCTCHPGWTGILCNLDIDECHSDPCVQGECQDGLNGYTCDCYDGYTGVDCSEDIDECQSSPCVNGDCVNGEQNKYTCKCLPGWTGVNCDTDIDECASNPCVEGACENKPNHYLCRCKVGWNGHHCDQQCKETPFGDTYAGQLSMSRNGRTCQRWDSQVPNQHSHNDPSFFPDDTVQDAANYCRQANWGDQGPWCYNMEGGWDYCDVPLCELPATDCQTGIAGSDYMGRKAYNKDSRTCQRWDSQTPNAHTYTAEHFPDATVEDAVNYCRDLGHGVYAPWCYHASRTGWRYCDIPWCELPATDCKTKKAGSDYMGIMAYNKDSRKCQRWDSQTPNAHRYTVEHFPDATVEDAVNYCRDLGLGGDAPWCYHASAPGWSYCEIPWCASTDCKYSQKGDEYSGTLSVNRAGHMCQRWDSDSPNQHDYDDPEEFPYDESEADAANYCRRADWGHDGPWCYHADVGGWEYCDIRYCPADDCKRSQKGDEYVGTMSTNKGGGTCQRWDSQSPNAHGYNTSESFPYDESVEAAANYCRRANWGDQGPWCNDMAGGWKYCDIPYC